MLPTADGAVVPGVQYLGENLLPATTGRGCSWA